MIVLLIAIVVGLAGGYYFSVTLMDSIWDYFVKVGPGILLSAALIMIIATVLTLSVRVTRAAMKNPADSLRYE
jgi:ABC-type antimicrobial peptide transport system permease subunit